MNSTNSLIETQRHRRVALKRKRRIRLFQSLWRSLLVSTMAGGLVWATFLPQWKIQEPQQISIQGNQYLTDQALSEIIVDTTSESIITVAPQDIASKLQEETSVKDVSVSRKLYPPRLIITVQEREPVARTVPHSQVSEIQQQGYLDAKGVWMPKQYYQSSEQFPTPPFTIIGYRPQYRWQWVQLYQKFKNSPIEIQTLHWQDPANLILETELGMVHLGGNLESISQQIRKLAQLQTLPQRLSLNDIRYINLKNPDFILLDLVPQARNNDEPK